MSIKMLLFEPSKFVETVTKSEQLSKEIKSLLQTSLIMFAVYGFFLGIPHSFLQGISSLLKLPILFYLATAICLPTFYLFGTTFGMKLSLKQFFTIILGMLTTSSTFAVSLLPISIFFWSIAPTEEAFLKLLNILLLGVAAIFGVKLLIIAIKQTTKTLKKGLLSLWIILYVLIGTQLSWSLRPFFGTLGEEFVVFRPTAGNFYIDVIRTLKKSFRREITPYHGMGFIPDKLENTSTSLEFESD